MRIVAQNETSTAVIHSVALTMTLMNHDQTSQRVSNTLCRKVSHLVHTLTKMWTLTHLTFFKEKRWIWWGKSRHVKVRHWAVLTWFSDTVTIWMLRTGAWTLQTVLCKLTLKEGPLKDTHILWSLTVWASWIYSVDDEWPKVIAAVVGTQDQQTLHNKHSVRSRGWYHTRVSYADSVYQRCAVRPLIIHCALSKWYSVWELRDPNSINTVLEKCSKTT